MLLRISLPNGPLPPTPSLKGRGSYRVAASRRSLPECLQKAVYIDLVVVDVRADP